MRRGNDAYIRFNGFITAYPLEGMLLQNTQNFHLHIQWHVANFIQEQRAAFGHFKTARTAVNGSGKGALFMAEQFTFQQFSRNSATVNRHKRFITTMGMVMQIARNDFFAGARFALNHHADVFIGNLHNQFTNMLNLTAGTDQAAEQLHFTALAATAVVGILLTIYLTAVQAVQQFVVTRWHVDIRQQSTMNVLRHRAG